MGIKDKRKILRTGLYSRAVTLPAKLKIGDFATLAANRIIIIDPRGEISEEALLEFLEEVIEPNLWQWLKQQEADNNA